MVTSTIEINTSDLSGGYKLPTTHTFAMVLYYHGSKMSEARRERIVFGTSLEQLREVYHAKYHPTFEMCISGKVSEVMNEMPSYDLEDLIPIDSIIMLENSEDNFSTADITDCLPIGGKPLIRSPDYLLTLVSTPDYITDGTTFYFREYRLFEGAIMGDSPVHPLFLRDSLLKFGISEAYITRLTKIVHTLVYEAPIYGS